MSVWSTLLVKISQKHLKVGVTSHFQASWASQPMGCLLYFGSFSSIISFICAGHRADYLSIFEAPTMIVLQATSRPQREDVSNIPALMYD